VFIEAKDDGGGGNNWTTGAISRAKLQSNHHHQQTNAMFCTNKGNAIKRAIFVIDDWTVFHCLSRCVTGCAVWWMLSYSVVTAADAGIFLGC